MQVVAKSRKKLTDPDEIRISVNIKNFREATEAITGTGKPFSQAEIAAMAHIPTANYIRYEIGENTPSANTLMKLADEANRLQAEINRTALVREKKKLSK